MDFALAKQRRNMSQGADDSWAQSSSVFVASTGRTGSDTLIKVLQHAENVIAHHEPHPRMREYTNDSFQNVAVERERFRQVFLSARSDLISEAFRARKIYVESTLMKGFLPVILDTLPNSKLVHLVRHPGGVVRSGMRRGWYESHVHDRWRLQPGVSSPIRKLWDTKWSRFEKICWYWHAINEFILEAGDSVQPERRRIVKFEAFVDPDTGALKELLHFIGVARISAEAIASTLDAKHNRQESGTFPPYTEWSDQQREQLGQIAGTTMVRLGYAL
ncbi:MAG: sulfotransferase [Burkholderiaceae bacterium]|jgi:hypothetical protein|nr:sulfotransferase [Burkholderiaceae bacterium]